MRVVEPADRPTHWTVIGVGFVGSALTEHLQSISVPVLTLRAPRVMAPPTSTAASLAAAVDTHPAARELAGELAGTDCVVLAGGLAQPDARPSSALVGANALLPGLVLAAARDAGVRRFVHLSSAAVQGRTEVLTEKPAVAPFSAYSHSKALGEAVMAHLSCESLSSVVLRATSVQGPGRRTTASLRRIARSPLASVARPGTQPSAVSGVASLCRFVHHVGSWPDPVPPIVLQPWDGLSVTEVLSVAGGAESFGYRPDSVGPQ